MDTTIETLPRGSRLRSLLPHVLVASLALGMGACSSDDDDNNNNNGGGGGGGVVTLNTLSGTVRSGSTEGGTAGGPLAGVTVRAGNAEGVTNATGQFILTSVGMFPSGEVVVELDGTTAGVAGQFPLLDIVVQLAPGATEAFLPQVITLPDLTNSASSTQAVMTDASGATMDPINVVGTENDMVLAGPLGTIITIGGTASSQMVNLNMSPVPAAEVPMPLPSGLLGGGFVTIQPGNSAFDPPPAGGTDGLDVLLPNDMNLPEGTMVDIYSFDHDALDWVNRSAETGNQGVVVEVGGVGSGEFAIDADGVITEGGWHTGGIDVDPDCATTVIGRVVDMQDPPNPIPNASIALFTGQFTTSRSDGTFSIPLVPAYDIAALANDPKDCNAVDICYEVVLSPSNGSVSSDKQVFAVADGVMTGGTTDLGDIQIALPNTGNLAGIVNGPLTVDEPVMITGPTSTSVVPQQNGTFFVTGLDAGTYMASYLFDGRTNPTTVSFGITAGQTTTITIQAPMGGGEGDVTVHVFIGDDDSPGGVFMPLPGATVTLRDANGSTMNGITDSNGQLGIDNVDAPYDVTAQIDMVVGGTQTLRFGGSVLDITPPSGMIGVPIFFSDAPQPVTDATLMGTLMNAPTLGANEGLMIDVIDTVRGVFSSPIDAQGNFSVNVPSETTLHAIVYLADISAGQFEPAPPIASLDSLNIAPIMSGQTGTLDLDWDGGGRVEWNVPVMFGFSGVDAGATEAEIDVTLEMGDILFDFDLYRGPVTTFAANLPDATNANLSGYELIVEGNVDSSNFDLNQSCESVFATTPSTHTFELLSAPGLIAPFDGAMYTVSQIENLDTAWTLGAPGTLTEGVEIFLLSGFAKADPPTGFVWQMFVPVGTTGFRMPPTTLPMFGTGQFNGANIGKTRFDGITFDFDSFFNENVATNLGAIDDALNSACESGDAVQFTVQ